MHKEKIIRIKFVRKHHFLDSDFGTGFFFVSLDLSAFSFSSRSLLAFIIATIFWNSYSCSCLALSYFSVNAGFSSFSVFSYCSGFSSFSYSAISRICCSKAISSSYFCYCSSFSFYELSATGNTTVF